MKDGVENTPDSRTALRADLVGQLEELHATTRQQHAACKNYQEAQRLLAKCDGIHAAIVLVRGGECPDCGRLGCAGS